jgi:hypothetical protein
MTLRKAYFGQKNQLLKFKQAIRPHSQSFHYASNQRQSVASPLALIVVKYFNGEVEFGSSDSFIYKTIMKSQRRGRYVNVVV